MRKLIAIIPARGGSQRLKKKNIYPMKGKPLIEYSIEACKSSKYVKDVFVSSDDREILDISNNAGAKELLRNAKLADHDTPKIVAIRAAIKQLEALQIDFHDVAIIQANSPEISADNIDSAYQLMLDHNLWEVMSADKNGVQNAAIRIVKKEVAFQEFLSVHCGFVTCDLTDVHTIEDIQRLESQL